MEPVARMDGDSLPVSAFYNHADGTFEQGAAAFEKRGVAVTVPSWETEKCIQCNHALMSARTLPFVPSHLQ
jgi:pyruvate-ferredoxin/flavodoxin oxidoreductase